MRRCEEPPPGPTSRHCCIYPPKPHWLGVRGGRITGHVTSGGRRNVRPAARFPDQRGRNLLLFVVVVGDPHEPATLRSMAGLHRQCLRRGWLRGHWPLPRHPVLGGRRRSVYRAASSTAGSTPAGWSISGANDTYTEHRSISPICIEQTISYQSRDCSDHITM